MREYVVRQVVGMIPVLIIVSIISFGLLYVLPGDPATAILGENAGNPATYEALRHNLGLDRPLWMQYTDWLGRLLQGDMGKSIRTGEPVSVVLLQRIPVTLYVGFGGLLVGVLIGLTAAIVSAVRPGGKLDLAGTVFALGGIAIPSFWQALLFIYVFALVLRWLPPSGYTPLLTDPGTSLRMLIMPEYVVVARAKGLREPRVVLVHALKNAMIPIVTILGLQVGNLVAGAAITETIFAIPGVGRAAVDAIFFRDFPVLQGAVIVLTVGVMLANLLADIAYAYFDPRIRLS